MKLCSCWNQLLVKTIFKYVRSVLSHNTAGVSSILCTEYTGNIPTKHHA